MIAGLNGRKVLCKKKKKKSKEYVIVRNKDAAQSTVPSDSLGALNPPQRPLDVPLTH